MKPTLMKKTIYIFLLVLAFGSAASAQETKQLFTMIYSKGEAWQEEKPTTEQPYINEHFGYMQQLRKGGVIVMGGRYSNLGFMIIEVADEAAAQAIVQADPALSNGIFIADVFAFSPFYNGCIGEQKE
jgi:uncharacterized protein YciI